MLESYNTNATVCRGDVYYISRGSTTTTGSEEYSNRPGVIISNDEINKKSEIFTVVYLTTKERHALMPHPHITSTGTDAFAICEQPTTVSKERLRQRMCSLSGEEMERIDAAILAALGFAELTHLEESNPNAAEKEAAVYNEFTNEWEIELWKLKAEKDAYKSMFEDLIGRITGIEKKL